MEKSSEEETTHQESCGVIFGRVLHANEGASHQRREQDPMGGSASHHEGQTPLGIAEGLEATSS